MKINFILFYFKNLLHLYNLAFTNCVGTSIPLPESLVCIAIIWIGTNSNLSTKCKLYSLYFLKKVFLASKIGQFVCGFDP
jgi:hypothetical protein